MLDREFFQKEGANTRDRYRDHIFRKAKDIKGSTFKPYKSKEYAQRKQAGKFKGFTKGDKPTSPVLTGDLLRDYSLVEVSNNGFAIGWIAQGAKVEWLKDNGRVLTTSKKPLPEKILKNLFSKANLYIKKKTKKVIPNKVVRHKIGK